MFNFLVPIIAAIVILILSITIQVASAAEIIATVGWILVIGLSVLIIIFGLLRKVPVGEKIVGIIVSIIATVISVVESRTFLGAITTIDTSGLMGIIEFLFVFVFGGLLWLSGVGLCVYASYWAVTDEEDSPAKFFNSVGGIIGSLLLCGFFGFFG
ncbi:MAG: hypothetical protein E7570_02220 [Ruminococcaceae bacterium]|nr:hypothetical protein [Oscillospiraceae bacterium]